MVEQYVVMDIVVIVHSSGWNMKHIYIYILYIYICIYIYIVTSLRPSPEIMLSEAKLSLKSLALQMSDW